MSGGAVAALIAAIAFAVLVGLVAVPLRKFGRTLDEAALTLRAAREQGTVVLPGGPGTATVLDGQVVQLEPAGRAELPAPAAPVLAAVVTTALGGPLIKAAAFGYGVRSSVQKRTTKNGSHR